MRGYKEEKADSESSVLERHCRELREVDQDIYEDRETEVLKVEVGLQQCRSISARVSVPD